MQKEGNKVNTRDERRQFQTKAVDDELGSPRVPVVYLRNNK
jgi:hypothetical protein